MRGKPAGMRRVPINPPRGHDPEQHKIVGPIHSWDPPKDGVVYQNHSIRLQQERSELAMPE
jgi:hypothetical protein